MVIAPDFRRVIEVVPDTSVAVPGFLRKVEVRSFLPQSAFDEEGQLRSWFVEGESAHGLSLLAAVSYLSTASGPSSSSKSAHFRQKIVKQGETYGQFLWPPR
jgi:hypothetical protein